MVLKSSEKFRCMLHEMVVPVIQTDFAMHSVSCGHARQDSGTGDPLKYSFR